MKFIREKIKLIIIIIFIYTFVLGIILMQQKDIDIDIVMPIEEKQLHIRSIDTMKYSRDLAAEKLNDASFDIVIDKQVGDIAATGANFVAIGTPYDEQFIPFLRRWVDSAREHNLHVWFRGNFSGWEGWFNYERIDKDTHIVKTKKFILENPDMFRDGDLFTSCPECENGYKVEWGDPASLREHRDFIIKEYQVAKDSFAAIDKDVDPGYYSMNGDLARVFMDKETTRALGGVVVVDHYVRTPEQLATDIKDYADRSGGRVMLGEFGAPIPDIHGDMTEEEQSEWISEAFEEMSTIPNLIGINYWVNVGGSTAIWNPDGSSREAVSVIKKWFSKKFFWH